MPERIQIIEADITTLPVEAIVNAANTSLLGGGGVDGAIHRAAGPRLLAECQTLNGCPTGEARLTGGYSLPAKYVIHTVGPIWRGGESDEANLLASCYRACFRLVRENAITSVAFPAISCGVYRFPVEQACAIAFAEALEGAARNDWLQTIIFACTNPRVFEALARQKNACR
ncbi:MAG: O-acetyl-ADP-ribose deacetylase [Desulfopila sp.]